MNRNLEGSNWRSWLLLASALACAGIRPLVASRDPVDLGAGPANECNGTHVVVGVMSDAPTPSCENGPPWWRFVRVQRWIKGTGPDTVTVASFAGRCVRKTTGGGSIVVAVVSGMPALPDPGTRVLILMSAYAQSATFQPSRVIELNGPESEDAIRNVEVACGGAKPNTRVNPPVGPVTALAQDARTAPVPPAGYAQR